MALSPCPLVPRRAEVEAAAEAPNRPRVPVRPLQQSILMVLSPPDKCQSGSEPRPSRQRRLKFVSSNPPLGIGWTFHYRFLTALKLGFDRWNLVHLKPWLLTPAFSEQVIKDKFVGFGQGFKDMSPALRDLESIILEKKLRHGGHPVLTMCSNNAVIERDPAGNRKLSKKRATGRIDGMIALLIAIGVAPQQAAKVDIEALIG